MKISILRISIWDILLWLLKNEDIKLQKPASLFLLKVYPAGYKGLLAQEN